MRPCVSACASGYSVFSGQSQSWRSPKALARTPMLKPPPQQRLRHWQTPARPRRHMGEFDLIARYFTRPARHAALGVGDDCPLLQPRPHTQMAISSDMLVSGRHFFADVDPRTLGHKALAVNLSDLAA